MEKEIVKKNSSKCELLMVLERMEMGEGVKKVLKEDVKRKRRSYDKFIGFIGKKKKLGNGLKECDLEENRIKWKEFRVSFVSIILVVFECLLIII